MLSGDDMLLLGTSIEEVAFGKNKFVAALVDMNVSDLKQKIFIRQESSISYSNVIYRQRGVYSSIGVSREYGRQFFKDDAGERAVR